MKIISKIIIGFIVLNVLSYFLLSQTVSERTVNNEYYNFTKKRLINEWVKDTSEVIILASCGDEFFRQKDKIKAIIEKSNPKNTINDYSYSYWRDNYDIDPMTVLNKVTDSLKSKNCIIYKVCSEKTIPSVIKRVNYKYFFSDSETDYHIMFHNKQMELKTITYVWFLGFWVKISEENKTSTNIVY